MLTLACNDDDNNAANNTNTNDDYMHIMIALTQLCLSAVLTNSIRCLLARPYRD